MQSQVLGVDLNHPESSRPALPFAPPHSAAASCSKRAANPLHRAGINSKLFGNDADTGPPRSRQSLTDSLFQCGGDWEAFTLTPGPREASTDSFLNHRPLELGLRSSPPIFLFLPLHSRACRVLRFEPLR
jgi:hypothetical protein